MSEQTLQIKDLSEDDRPREKLLKYGPSYLTNAELLAIIIGSGTKGNSAIQLAQKLLSYYDNDLNKIALQHPLALKDTQKGLGEVRCINILAALELGKRRYISENIKEKQPIISSQLAANYLMRYLSDKVQEEFWMLALNNSNIPIDCYQIGKGSYDKAIVEVRQLCKMAIISNATSVIIAHNHPSGTLQPSDDDIKITQKIKETLSLFNIRLWDHLIIYQNLYFSFTDNNLI